VPNAIFIFLAPPSIAGAGGAAQTRTPSPTPNEAAYPERYMEMEALDTYVTGSLTTITGWMRQSARLAAS